MRLLLLLLLPSFAMAAPKWSPPVAQRVAAGLHDGDQFAPRLRPDGEWIAYGVREVTGKKRVRWYKRSLDGDALAFKSVWPNQHPSFEGKEGTASFTDLLDFRWHPEGKHNAMVVRHKTKGDEVLLELLKVRVGGPGDQGAPLFNDDGTKLIVVAQGDLGREMWLAPVEHEAQLEQLTYTVDTEAWMDWSADSTKVVHEIVNKKTGRGDLFVLDMQYYEQLPLLRWPDSDESRPTYGPSGRIWFLSNKADAGRRDLYSIKQDGSDERLILKGIVRTDDSRGYAWDPAGRFLIAAADSGKGARLIALTPDGKTQRDLGFAGIRIGEPGLVHLPSIEAVEAVEAVEASEGVEAIAGVEGVPGRPESLRLAWTARNTTGPEERRYRVTFVADLEIAAVWNLLGLKVEDPVSEAAAD